MSRPVILISTPYYEPGHKGGGPVVSLSRLVQRLSDEFRFKIITPNCDFKDARPFSDLPANKWIERGQTRVMYLSADRINRSSLTEILNGTSFDLLYLNSFFSPQFTFLPLLLRRLKRIPRSPVSLAPRGEFSPGALQLKSLKKKIYIRLAKLGHLYSEIHWQATSLAEETHIRTHFASANIHRAGNLLPDVYSEGESGHEGRKIQGALKVVFLSRIARKKNLKFVLESLIGLERDIDLDIYGPVEDAAYWSECRKIMDSMPERIRVIYKGDAPHSQVQNIFSRYDLFFFPTLGENFGHVILEALSAGCPVLLSDQTPWQDFERANAGWAVSLKEPDKFREIILKCADMNGSEFERYHEGARQYMEELQKKNVNEEQTREMFKQILARGI